jgi:hypothetical protein
LSSKTPPRPIDANDYRGLSETAVQWRTRRHAERITTLLAPLSDVELSVEDRHLIEWLAGWDAPVVDTVASLFRRVRAASFQGGQR